MAREKKNEIDYEKVFSNVAGELKKSSFKEFMQSDYLPYAHYTIQDRALVGEDGLKPVQRRGLWTLWKMGLKSSGGTKKANTVYGSTIGDYHPHGPASVSAAMAKLGQWFSSRVRTIEIQGSVGTETGDSPSADRYYEIKLSKAGELLIEDVSNNAAVMIPNYSNEKGKEIPEQFPVKWPYDIINGGKGIAVGYATDMVPHNPTEVMNAVIERMKGNLNTTKKLLSIMKGPDMPTGGQLLGLDGVKEYYETGSGSFIIRGTYEINPLPRGRHEIVFNSLPYQIAPVTVQTEIKKAQTKKDKLKDVTEVKNLTDMDTGVKFVVYVKAGANPHMVLEELFNETSLQSRYNVNNVVLIDRKPHKATMFELIDKFIQFREECFERKLNYRLKVIDKEIVKAQTLTTILLDIDKAIEIIRKSDDSEVAKTKLMKHFKIEEDGAIYVLSMRLQQLTKQDKLALKNKIENLLKEQKELTETLSSEENLKKAIISELQETKKIIQDNRLTVVTDITNEDLLESQKNAKKQEKLLGKDVDCKVIVLSNDKIYKTIEDTPFDSKIPTKYEINTTSQGKLYGLMKNGKLKEIDVDSIILDDYTDISTLGIKPENLSSIVPVELDDDKKILVVTDFGNVNIFKNIKDPFIKLILDEQIIYSKIITDEDKNKDLAIISSDGMLAKFSIDKIRESNSGSGTIAGMKVSNRATDATIVKENDLVVTRGTKTIKVTENDIIPSTNRGVKGSMLHKPLKDEEIIEIYSDYEPVLLDKETLKAIKLPKDSERATKGKSFKSEIVLQVNK